MEIFRTMPRIEGFRKRAARFAEMALKCLLIVIAPIPLSALACAVWHYAFYKQGFYFSEKMETIVTAAWIPTFSLLYSLLVAVVFNTVWAEYKEMRGAVKRYDIEKFVDLRDEEMSPVVFTLVTIVSLFVLGGFMAIHYPEWRYGIATIATTSYLFGLIFFVVKEIDDPCCGIWYIKNIPPEWLDLDVKGWRRRRHAEERRKYAGRLRGLIFGSEDVIIDLDQTGASASDREPVGPRV